jgi:ATP-dependent protease ClpP protease subunit
MNIRKPYADLFKERIGAAATLTVQNRDGADGPAVVRIYGIIDDWFGISAEQVAAELEQITADEIEVQINSVGGSVFEGVAIFNALRAHPAKITTRVDGMAASIASVIVQAGDRRIMLTGSQMMIHEALAITIGNGEDHRKTAEILDVQTSIIAGIYAERSDTDADEWLALMAEETWFDHDGAVKAGLADEAVKPSRQPEDRVPSKFAADLEALVGAVEAFAGETEKVVAFRSEQGKTPLSDDAVASIDKLRAATERLGSASETEETCDITGEYARFVALTQGVTS